MTTTCMEGPLMIFFPLAHSVLCIDTCCAVLCCAMLCRAVSCCAMLWPGSRLSLRRSVMQQGGTTWSTHNRCVWGGGTGFYGARFHFKPQTAGVSVVCVWGGASKGIACQHAHTGSEAYRQP